MADVAAEVGALGVASKAASPKLSHHEAFAQEARWIAHSMGLSIDQQQLDRQPRSAAPAAAAAGTDDDLGDHMHPLSACSCMALLAAR